MRRLVLVHGVLAAACGPNAGDATTGESTSGAASSSDGTRSGVTQASTGSSDASSGETGAPACEGVLPLWLGDLRIDARAQPSAEELACIREVEGALVVEGTDWSSLAPVSGITRVGGHVAIEENPQLMTLAGLEGLAEVGGVVNLFHNTALTDLTALSGIERVGGLAVNFNGSISDITSLQGDVVFLDGTISIGHEPALVDLDGLEALGTVESAGQLLVEIHFMNALQNVDGLAALAELGDRLDVTAGHLPALVDFGFTATEVGSVTVFEAPALASLATFAGLQVGHALVIDTQNALVDLDGLESLHTVTDRLIVGRCFPEQSGSQLGSLEGLAALVAVERLVITGNPLLTDLDPLPTGPAIAIGSLHIRDNTSLPTAVATAYAEAVGMARSAEICGNAGDPACANADACVR